MDSSVLQAVTVSSWHAHGILPGRAMKECIAFNHRVFVIGVAHLLVRIHQHIDFDYGDILLPCYLHTQLMSA